MRLVSRAHLDFKVASTAALPFDELVGHTEGLLAFTGTLQRHPRPFARLRGRGRRRSTRLDRLAQAVRRPALSRAAAPRRGQRAAHRGAAARPRLCQGPADRRHQRRALPQGVDVRGARRAALHRAGRAYRGPQPPPPDARALFQVGGRRCARSSPTCPRPATTPWSIAQRCAYMPEPRKPILPSYTKLQGRSEDEALRDLARTRPRRAARRSAGWPPASTSSKYEERLALRART